MKTNLHETIVATTTNTNGARAKFQIPIMTSETAQRPSQGTLNCYPKSMKFWALAIPGYSGHQAIAEVVSPLLLFLMHAEDPAQSD